MKATLPLLLASLLIGAPLFAAESAPPAGPAAELGLEKPLERELANLVLSALDEEKAALGTNSSADFAEVIRHAVVLVEKKGANAAEVKLARENAKEFGQALVEEVSKDRKAGETFAGRITRAELSAVMGRERPLWPFTTNVALTAPIVVPAPAE